MTRVGDSGELGKDARVPGADFVELDVGDRLQAPIQTCPLGVGERWGELLELDCVQEEETGTETVDGGTVLAVGRVWDRDVVEDSEACARGLELGSDDFEEVRDVQTLEIKSTGRGHRGDRGEGGGSLSGGDARGEGGTGEALLEGAALLLSALIGDKALD